MTQLIQPDELSDLAKHFERAWSELEPKLSNDENAEFLRRRLAQLMISLRSSHQSPEELVAAAKRLLIQQHAPEQPVTLPDAPEEQRPSL
ncbi:MAG: hypothetical protein APF80_04210 [Alphaproteobacteria bacterium BRH_c36]|nr:MAG: hypothetical protein APF80_04210 [Alphaproteobacteria bacterium BRH_c36]